MTKTERNAERGDFQTPLELARTICARAWTEPSSPGAVFEPTCGLGSFLLAAHARFGDEAQLIGVDIDQAYVEAAGEALGTEGATASLSVADFFGLDLQALLRDAPRPLLVLGNPPWVTNAQLGALGSDNLPDKSNFQRHAGLDARTGKSNFDISEWMTIRLLEVLAEQDAQVALLLKTAVARKVLEHAWRSGLAVSEAQLIGVDAKAHFGASVDACLFRVSTRAKGPREAAVFDDLDAASPRQVFGYDESGLLVADVGARRRTTTLEGDGVDVWRSGVKHDCSAVLELRREAGRLVNGAGESVDVEPEVLFPLLKSSDVVNGRLDGDRWLLLPQTAVGEDTSGLAETAPKAYAYLEAHGARLDARKSSIYRGRPRFSVFGVGPYSFTDWKIAISGLYKRLTFTLIPPVEGRPVVFDDTVYLLPCAGELDARRRLAALESDLARDFFSAFVFWDSKRPITAKLLRRLDIRKLMDALEPKRTQLSLRF